MTYDFKKIEQKWRKRWDDDQVYRVEMEESRPKCYVLDMFPYPSGAGLHVGHPLGYIASDIYSRYKRLQGFNVLHPIGYDAFGLPAEQYAIETGQHPAVTTAENIAGYQKQLRRIGFSFDLNRELRTSDPSYYKWTQWAFIEFFNHWYDLESGRAEPIETLKGRFRREGNRNVRAASSYERLFDEKTWLGMSEDEQQSVLSHYRLVYLDDSLVNWCAKLGTVLANDEVRDGESVRGGHPVTQKVMKQWSWRITAYAQRLLDGLEKIDWPESVKEMQRNWIGRSEGAEVRFPLVDSDEMINIYTTRPDTIFGATFMVLAPESELVEKVVTQDQKSQVGDYLERVKRLSERDRMINKKVTGVFTGSHCTNPFTGQAIPIWIADYVLGGYGTGAIMAVPAHDSRDHAFAKEFNLPIVAVIGKDDCQQQSYEEKSGTMVNSDFLNGLTINDAIAKSIQVIEDRALGQRKIHYRLRDAIFGRQRYWGEPFPMKYVDGTPQPLDLEELPLELPKIDKYLPTEDGQPPLGRAANWHSRSGHPLELSTMPGFAGSSAYFLRYMDPQNTEKLVSRKANEYWKNVDLYVGGKEHATGHLIYSRVWNMFLYDIGQVCEEEPFKRMINQGMIQGTSALVYRIKGTNKFVSYSLKDQYDVTPIHVDVTLVNKGALDLERFRKWRPEYVDAEFELEDGRYVVGRQMEKMSKSLFNVVNPDDVIDQYGADTFRLFEMFLGPIDQSKPWNTDSIEGVHRFLGKLWRLYVGADGDIIEDHGDPTDEEWKVLHKTIKKVYDDLENLGFNTTISAFMICVNELGRMGCHKRKLLSELLILVSPFVPFMAQELWEMMGNDDYILDARLPVAEEKFLQEDYFTYPVSFNGKLKFLIELPVDCQKKEIEKKVWEDERLSKFLGDRKVKKMIVIPGKIVNVVV